VNLERVFLNMSVLLTKRKIRSAMLRDETTASAA